MRSLRAVSIFVIVVGLAGCGDASVVTSPAPPSGGASPSARPVGGRPGSTPSSNPSPNVPPNASPSASPTASPVASPGAPSSARPTPAASAAPYTGDSNCLVAPSDYGSPHPPLALRFGITPDAAGSAGAVQGPVAPQDPARARAALLALRPPGRELILRFNRLFEADGQSGIDAFAAKVDDAAAAGLRSEVQVRYHPGTGQDGDMTVWESFVRAAVRTLARRPSLVALSITNEVNFPISSNTSDGAYTNAEQAIVVGIVAAREQLDAMGRSDVAVGFTFAWRYSPPSDLNFWTTLGTLGTTAFRNDLDYVGLQIYPGLVYPPAPLPGRSAGRETTDALALLRRCYMPKASLGDRVALWVTENGYATNLGRSEANQVADLTSTLQAVHDVSGTLGVTDYRYFNLRDNSSMGTDLFAAVGVLRDDYTQKPAYTTLSQAISAFGAPPR